MSQEQEKRERSHLQHEAEHAKPHKKVSVMGYLAILFAAAFLLLLLSYFMQQRSSEQTISGLKDSVSAMQSVENLIADNDELHQKVDELETQIEALETAKAELERTQRAQESTVSELENQVASMDWLWRIQRAYSRGSKTDCRALVDQFEASGLPQYLSNTTLAQVEGPSPADQYNALLDALDYRPEP